MSNHYRMSEDNDTTDASNTALVRAWAGCPGLADKIEAFGTDLDTLETLDAIDYQAWSAAAVLQILHRNQQKKKSSRSVVVDDRVPVTAFQKILRLWTLLADDRKRRLTSKRQFVENDGLELLLSSMELHETKSPLVQVLGARLVYHLLRDECIVFSNSINDDDALVERLTGPLVRALQVHRTHRAVQAMGIRALAALWSSLAQSRRVRVGVPPHGLEVTVRAVETFGNSDHHGSAMVQHACRLLRLWCESSPETCHILMHCLVDPSAPLRTALEQTSDNLSLDVLLLRLVVANSNNNNPT